MADNALLGALSGYGGLKLSDQQRSRIAELLAAKLGSRACEMCSQVSWAVTHHLVQPVPLLINYGTGTYTQDFSASYPSAQVVCTNCGNSKLFLITQLGFDPFGDD